MRITFDLDDVIFDTRPLFKRAFQNTGYTFLKYTEYTDWDLRKCYDDDVVNELLKLFADDIMYKMRVLDKKIPYILNNLMQKPNMEVLFVTERILKQPQKTFNQLLNAGIKCSFEQVYDQEGKKSDILRELKPDFHFDDSPRVIKECIEKDIPIVMISNGSTKYNHFLRGTVPHYPTLRTALIKLGIYKHIHINKYPR